jgi:hypothetical protein
MGTGKSLDACNKSMSTNNRSMETGGSNPADMVAGPEELQSMEGLKTLQ